MASPNCRAGAFSVPRLPCRACRAKAHSPRSHVPEPPTDRPRCSLRRCLHVLALGPHSLNSLEQQLQSAKQQQHVPPTADLRSLPKILAQAVQPP